jgi:hypothetical protein
MIPTFALSEPLQRRDLQGRLPHVYAVPLFELNGGLQAYNSMESSLTLVQCAAFVYYCCSLS